MNAFEKIQSAAQSVGVKAFPHTYSGQEKRWITYQVITERGELFGDDEPGTVVSRVMINLFIPVRENYIELKDKLRRALFAQGFTWPEIVNTSIESDTGLRHIVFECEDEDEF